MNPFRLSASPPFRTSAYSAVLRGMLSRTLVGCGNVPFGFGPICKKNRLGDIELIIRYGFARDWQSPRMATQKKIPYSIYINPSRRFSGQFGVCVSCELHVGYPTPCHISLVPEALYLAELGC